MFHENLIKVVSFKIHWMNVLVASDGQAIEGSQDPANITTLMRQDISWTRFVMKKTNQCFIENKTLNNYSNFKNMSWFYRLLRTLTSWVVYWIATLKTTNWVLVNFLYMLKLFCILFNSNLAFFILPSLLTFVKTRTK